MFVRYEDTKALKLHDKAPEHQEVVYVGLPVIQLQQCRITDWWNSTKLGQMITNNIGQTTTLWKEVDDSFVSSAIGGDSSAHRVASRL